jgi:hypothetical protein
MTGRGLRGRRIARLTLVAALASVVVTVAVLAAPANTMGPSVSPFAAWTTWLGLAGAATGLAWMVRIVRGASQPERGPSSWRATNRR